MKQERMTEYTTPEVEIVPIEIARTILSNTETIEGEEVECPTFQ